MKTLCDRIDQVRSGHSELAVRMKWVGNEIPSHVERSTVMELSEALEQNAPSQMLVERFPDFCWLLTLRSPFAATEGLGLVLEQSAFRRRDRRRKFRVVAYPMLLIVLVGAIFVAACLFVVPEYEAMFREFDLYLPTPTLRVIQASQFLRSRPVVSLAIFALVIGTLAFGFWVWIGARPGKPRSATSPRSRDSIQQSLSKAAIQLAELIDDHVSIQRAVAIASQSCGNPKIRTAFAELASRLPGDVSAEVERPQRVGNVLPANLRRALTQNPVNTALMRELSATYRERWSRHRSWVSYLIGPLAVIGIGLVIAFILLALCLPMISLITSMSS